MGAVLNGLSLSKMRPYGSGFLIFSDYGRAPIRLAAIMEIPVIYVFTHDSIGVGEDGPTHQPVEQLLSLRAIPGLVTIRPCDANEVVEAWRVTLGIRHEPVALVLTRQALPTLDRTKYAPASGLAKGAYVLADAQGGKPEVLLIGTGSEVSLCVDGSRDAGEGRHPQPRRQHAVVGAVREAARGVSRDRPAGVGHGQGRGRTGLDARVGAIRRHERTRDRHEDVRRVGSSQGAAEEVRLRAGTRGGRGEAAAGTRLSTRRRTAPCSSE